MTAKEVVVITGANKGIGFETVKALLQSTEVYHIFLGSRSLKNGEQAAAELVALIPGTKSVVEVLQIDVTDDTCIQNAADVVGRKFGKLDALINNAGILLDGPLSEDSPNFRSIFNKSFDVNVTGAQVMTAAFSHLLIKSSNPRLIFLTSGSATLEGHLQLFLPAGSTVPAAGWPKGDLRARQSYKVTKTALNMLMLTWHWVLKDDGVKTWSISPGFLATDLSGNTDAMRAAGGGDPALGGSLLRSVLEGERDADVGKVIMQNGKVQAW